MKKFRRLLPFLLAFAFVACSQPPKAEIDAAEAAFAKAKASSDVAAYAPEALDRAVAAIGQMRDEVAAKRYDRAKDAAIQARTAAENCFPAAEAGKERAKAKADDALAAAKAAAPQVEKLLANAAKVKKAKLDLAALQAQLKGAQDSLAAADDAYAKDDYIAATTKAEDAQKAFADLQAAISSAVQGATRKK